MNTTRVALTIDRCLHFDLLKNSLAARPDVEVVGECIGMVDTLMLIASTRPDLWIHSWDEGDDLNAALSHLLSIHPSLAVMRVHPDEPAGCLQLQVHSISQLFEIANRTRSLLDHPSLEIAGSSP